MNARASWSEDAEIVAWEEAREEACGECYETLKGLFGVWGENLDDTLQSTTQPTTDDALEMLRELRIAYSNHIETRAARIVEMMEGR